MGHGCGGVDPCQYGESTDGTADGTATGAASVAAADGITGDGEAADGDATAEDRGCGRKPSGGAICPENIAPALNVETRPRFAVPGAVPPLRRRSRVGGRAATAGAMEVAKAADAAAAAAADEGAAEDIVSLG